MKPNEALIAPPIFDKEAGKKMPPDSELWGEAVYGVFAEQWPDLAEMSAGDVEWDASRVDEEEGFGVGSIIVNSNNNIIKVPVVVKDFYLQPLDIFEENGKLSLLNNENVGMALRQQDSIGDPSMVPEKANFKSSDFTQWLTKGASPHSWKKKLTSFTKIASSLGGPYVQAFLDKLASVGVKNEAPKSSSYYLEKSGEDFIHMNLTGYMNGQVVTEDKIDNLSEHMTAVEGFDDAMKIAYNQGSSICLGEQDVELQKVGFVGLDVTGDVDPVSDPGVYKCKRVTDDGIQDVKTMVMVIHKLGKEAGEAPKDAKPELIFIVEDKEGKNGYDYALQEQAVGSKSSGGKFNYKGKAAPMTAVDRYQRGVLLYGGEKADSVCSEPVTVDRIANTLEGAIRVFMKSDRGDIHYLVNDDFAVPMVMDQSDPFYVVDAPVNLTGPNLAMLKLDSPVQLVSSLDKFQAVYDDGIMKSAGEGESMVVRNSGTDGLIETTFRRQTYTDTEPRFMARMLSIGVEPEKSASLIAEIKKSKSEGSRSPVVTVVGIKIAENQLPEYTMEHSNLVSDVQGMRADLIKAAAAMNASGQSSEEAESALMGFGMMDEENVRYFIELIPTFEEISNTLAKLLYSARTNIVEIDEGAVKSALTNITKIVGRLKEISSGVS